MVNVAALLRLVPYDFLQLPQLHLRRDHNQRSIAQRTQQGVLELADPSYAPRPSYYHCHPIGAKPLVALQGVCSGTPLVEAVGQHHRVFYGLASPCPRLGVIGWAASPRSVILPTPQCFLNGSRS